nr:MULTISPECIES: tetratricopeptide repeat protein [unclassified Desertifilum]
MALAQQHHLSGRLEQAIGLYQQIISQQPNCPEAFHSLGCIAQRQGNLTQANAYYQQAIALKPDYPEAYNNLGVLFWLQGSVDAALVAYRKAVEYQPNYAEAYNNLGVVLWRQGEYAEAIAAYRRAIALRADYLEAYNNLGAVLRSAGQLEDAIATYRFALRIQPDCAEVYNNLGIAYNDRGEVAEAIAQFRHAISLKPDYGEAYHYLGYCLSHDGQFEAAILALRQAIRLQPQDVKAYNRLGNVLQQQGQLEAAIAVYQKAIQVQPDYVKVYTNLAHTLEKANRLPEAISYFNRALSLDPENAIAHFGRAFCHLLQGDFTTGFAEYEWRWQMPGAVKREFSVPQWDGSSLVGKTILLHAEQGLGDAIQFIRYAPRVKAKGAQVIVECHDSLIRLFQTIPDIDGFVATGEALPPFDVHAPLLSLPHLLGTTLETLPAEVPYLGSGESRETQTATILKVGVAWRGQAAYERDRTRNRACPVELILSLSQLPGIQLYSLQKESLAELGVEAGTAIIDESLTIADFADTAKRIASVDLIISIDTSVAHLAGAMAKPTWVLLPYAPDWRWMREGNTSPWYPTMRLFRQTQPGDWHSVFTQVSAFLSAECKVLSASLSAECKVLSAEWEESAESQQGVESEVSPHPPISPSPHPLFPNPQLPTPNSLLPQPPTPNSQLPSSPHLLLAAIMERYQAGELEAAENLCWRGLQEFLSAPEIQYWLGLIYAKTGRVEQAIDCYQQVIAVYPHSSEVHHNLGVALHRLGKHQEAIAVYQTALQLEPNIPEIHNSLGVALQDIGKILTASEHFQAALRLNPHYAVALYNLGNTLLEQQQPQAAIACYQRVIAAIDYIPAYWNRAIAYLISGNLSQGFIEYEWRWRQRGVEPSYPETPLWDGTPLNGKTILLYSEQGFGDAIQFIRYVPLVVARGGRVLVQCPAALMRLFQTLPDVSGWVVSGETPPAVDVQAPLMSLPRILGTTLSTIPANIPYLPAQGLTTPLPATPHAKLRVGITWQCGQTAFQALQYQRSCPLSEFFPLFELADIQFYSLQRDLSDLDFLALQDYPRIVDLGDRILDFAATAEIISQLDLIITVDTAIAHLAGAMGKPVWVILPYTPDWRWMFDRTDSPWYPTMHLFRQPQPGDWKSVLVAVKNTLIEEKGIGGKKGVGNWELGVGEEGDGEKKGVGNWELGVREEEDGGMGGWGDGGKLQTQHPVETQHSLPTQHSALYTQHLEKHSALSTQHLEAANFYWQACEAHQQGRLTLAIAFYQQSIALKSDVAAVHRNLGIAFKQQGKIALAIASYRQAIATQADYAEAYISLGVILREQGQLEAAKNTLLALLEIQPNVPAAYNNLGNLYQDLQQSEAAIQAYRQAIALQPNYPEALMNLGTCLQEQGNYGDAEAYYRQVLTIQPKSASLHCNLGVVLHQQKRYAEAIDHYQQAIELNPEGAFIAYNNLGLALQEQDKISEAEACYRRAIALSPNYPDVHHNLGVVLMKQCRLEEAIAAYQTAIAQKPDFADPHFGLAATQLLQGNFRDGFAEYEWRWHIKGNTPQQLAQPLWDGSPLEGKTILLYSEQGFGDTLQFIRYVSLVKAKGAQIIVDCHPPLIRLLSQIPEIDSLVVRGEPLPPFDVQAPLLSLPHILGTTLETIPPPPQLPIPPTPHLPIPPSPHLKVGIVWAGSPNNKNDRTRSVSLSQFQPLFEIAGTEFYSLQKGENELSQHSQTYGVKDLAPQITDFADTADAIAQLDLIITVDTAVAHLAGTLGKPVWLLLSYSPDWRWLLERTDSPWYPSLRLFRQPRFGDWESVFQQLRAELENRVVGGGSQELLNRALSHHQAGELQQAQRIYQQILAIDPQCVEAIQLLGTVTHQLGDSQSAIAYLRQALTINPNYAEAHNNLGAALWQSEQSIKAIECYQSAIALKPDYLDAYNNLGIALRHHHQPQAAIEAYQKAIALQPNRADAYNNLGLAYRDLGEIESAIAQYQRAIQLNPNYADAHLNLAFAYLLLGNFQQGFAEYEWRWRHPNFNPNHSIPQFWDGTPLNGRTILLFAEQGLGDTLQFIRYAPRVKAQGGQVILECQPPLVRLLQNAPGIDQIISRGEQPLPPVDIKAPLLSLPHILGTTPETIPPPPHLPIPPSAHPISPSSHLKVGIVWAGSPHHKNNATRSIPFQQFKALLEIPNITFYSLQKGPRVADIDREYPNLISLDDQLNDFADTAAAIAQLDLIITVDTAVAHLAGTLGKPVWLLLCFSPDWRWMMQGESTPWYPTIRLFRQPQPGDWHSVFTQVSAFLSAECKVLSASLSAECKVLSAEWEESAECKVLSAEWEESVEGKVLSSEWEESAESQQSVESEVSPHPLTPNSQLLTPNSLLPPHLPISPSPHPLTPNSQLPTPNSLLPQPPTPNSQLPSSPHPLPIPQIPAKIGIGWPIGLATGWGVYGMNLALQLVKRGTTQPVLLLAPSVTAQAMNPLQQVLLQPALQAHQVLQALFQQYSNQQANFEFPVLHALGNQCSTSGEVLRFRGSQTLGAIFFEDTCWSAEAIAKAKAYDRIIAGSTWNAQVLRGYGLTNVCTALQGIDPTIFHPAPKANWFKDRFVIFSGGKLEYRKGQDIVIAAFKRFQQRHPEALLMTAWHNFWPQFMAGLENTGHVVGLPRVSAEKRLEIIPWLVKNGIPPEAIIDVGIVPNALVGQILREADVAVFPNRAEGGTNLAAMESLACGVPTILSANTGHLDLIDEAHCYSLKTQNPVQPTAQFPGTEGWGESQVDEVVEMLEQVYQNRACACQKGLAAAQFMQRLSWENQVNHLLQVAFS